MATAAYSSARRYERRPVKKIAHLFAISDDELCGAGAYTLDISQNGSRIHTILDLIPGQLLEYHPEGSEQILLARVVWTGSGAGEKREMGVEFLGSLARRPED